MGRFEGGMIYAELILPDGMENPNWRDGNRPRFSVEEVRNNAGQIEFLFETDWIGTKDYPDYRKYFERTMRELQNRVIDRCTPGKSL